MHLCFGDGILFLKFDKSAFILTLSVYKLGFFASQISSSPADLDDKVEKNLGEEIIGLLVIVLWIVPE